MRPPDPGTASLPRHAAARFRVRRWLLLLALLGLLGWSAGFCLFAERALRPPGPPPRADGVVALTGGAGRIEAALALLEAGRARLMLISGVQPDLDLERVLRGAGVHLADVPGLASRIALGHAATSTLGNAIETADWAHANGLHSLIVVTAGYHMQRSLSLIGAALPRATLLAYPVLPPALLRPASFGTLRLLLEEYNKWLLVASGLARPAHLGEVA